MCMSPLKLFSFRGLGQLRRWESGRSRHRARHLVGLQALPTTTSGFAHLFALLDRRLHVVPAPLQLAQDAFTRHLTLEVLDGSLDTLIANLDFKGFALNGFAGIRQGTGDMAEPPRDCKLLSKDSATSAPSSWSIRRILLAPSPPGSKPPMAPQSLRSAGRTATARNFRMKSCEATARAPAARVTPA